MTPFGLALVPEVYATSAGLAGSTVTERVDAVAVEQILESCRAGGKLVADDHHVFEGTEVGAHRLQVRDVVHGAEPVRDHEDTGV